MCFSSLGLSFIPYLLENFINTWVSTSTKGTSWNTAVNYCTWTSFSCDGNGNLVSMCEVFRFFFFFFPFSPCLIFLRNHTCSSSESFEFPPLDFWTTAAQNSTAFAFTTSMYLICHLSSCILISLFPPLFVSNSFFQHFHKLFNGLSSSILLGYLLAPTSFEF